jgi:hypothetical protein
VRTYVRTPPQRDEVTLRHCGRCGDSQPVEEFAWRRRARGQRDNYRVRCRAESKQERYAANHSRYTAQAQARKQVVAAERAARLIEFFHPHVCVDCGEDDPLVLEFDHRSEKLLRASETAAGRPVLDEIAKCDVVCANCHRRRTARRGRFARAVVAQR